jgi:hypothetical protein
MPGQAVREARAGTDAADNATSRSHDVGADRPDMAPSTPNHRAVAEAAAVFEA